ncbi:ATP-binding protein [Undibacterium terreum]|uniref:LuxR family transcriptional regulator n=1 Tax=Undibacterium terreum TaxID=1224302 RepID=A0A916UGJ6_9BURK|nr:LuxR family transcriptional regulator [Undibacterium terreum]GGC72968.1 LuxR family transcriptional regulator [Undibacterium terreum]
MLIERDFPMEKLLKSAAGLAAGRGELVFILGEAGIGKTSLLNEFTARLGRDCLILKGASEALFTARPLGPLRDMAQDMGDELISLLEEQIDSARLFPKILDHLKQAPRAIVMIFEDVHWADEATLDLLKYLGRRLASVPALLIATVRTDELSSDHAIWQVIGDIPSHLVARIMLQPLSPQAVDEMTKAAGKDSAGLHLVTGGNPFFVTELLGGQALSEGGIPASIREAVWARVSRLGGSEQQLLEMISVIPGSVEQWLFNMLAGSEAGILLDTCLNRGILIEDEHGHIQFRHELARQAVLERLSVSRRRALHARVLLALETYAASGGKPELTRQAHHAAEAEDIARLLDFAPRAASEAARLGAHKQAAALLARALKFVSHVSAPVAAQFYEDWAYEQGLSSIDDAVIHARGKALELWRSLGRTDKTGLNLRWLSRLHWYRGESELANRYSMEAVAELEGLPTSAGLAMAYSLRSQHYMLQDCPEDAISWGQRAITLAQELGDVETQVHALNNVGTAMLFSGREEGKPMLERSLELALQHDFHEHAARVYTNFSEYAVIFKQFDLADRLLEEGIAFDESHDLDAWTYYLVGWQAQLRMEQGNFRDAEAITRRVLSLEKLSLVMRLPALTVLGRVRARIGEPDGLNYLQEALDGASATGEIQRIVPVRLALAEAAWLAQDEAACRNWLESLAQFDLSGLDPWHKGEILAWHRRTGLLFPALATNHSVPAVMQAELAGDFLAAADIWLTLGLPFEAALALLHVDGERAEESSIQAATLFSQIGARTGVLLARKRAMELGVGHRVPKAKRGPYSVARQHPLGLTQREELVLSLIVEGLSNAEIARRLSRSSRTVEHHVSTLFNKIGASSRLDILARVSKQPDLYFYPPAGHR